MKLLLNFFRTIRGRINLHFNQKHGKSKFVLIDFFQFCTLVTGMTTKQTTQPVVFFRKSHQCSTKTSFGPNRISKYSVWYQLRFSTQKKLLYEFHTYYALSPYYPINFINLKNATGRFKMIPWSEIVKIFHFRSQRFRKTKLSLGILTPSNIRI